MDPHGQELRGCPLLSKAGDLRLAFQGIPSTPNPGPCPHPPCLQSSPSPQPTPDTRGGSPARPTAQVRSLSRRNNLQPWALGNHGRLKFSKPKGAKTSPQNRCPAPAPARPSPRRAPVQACIHMPVDKTLRTESGPRRSPEPKKRPFRDQVNTSCVFDNRCEALNELEWKIVQREEAAGIAQPGRNRVASARVKSCGPSCRGCKLCRRRAGARATVR